jgi:hypothetical protein
MQSAIKNADPNAPAKKTVLNTLSYIYKTNGLKGLYRGVAPRIGLGKLASAGTRQTTDNQVLGRLSVWSVSPIMSRLRKLPCLKPLAVTDV